MKLHYIFPIGAVALIFLILTEPGKTNSQGAEPANTGAPQESTCSEGFGCHGGSPNSGSGLIEVTIKQNGSPVNNYTPGETYQIAIKLDDQDMNDAGFQITARTADNNFKGQFMVNNNTKTVGTNDQYVTHTSPASSFEGNTQTWEIDWEAPSSSEGEITFYAAGNAANGNGNSSGDNIYTTSKTVQDDFSTSVGQSKRDASFKVFPNPVRQDLNLVNLPNRQKEPLTVKILNNNGQVIQTSTITDQNQQLQLSQDLDKGVYFVKIFSEGGTKTQKILKE